MNGKPWKSWLEKKERTPGDYQKAPQPKHLKLRLLRTTLKMIIINCASCYSWLENKKQKPLSLQSGAHFVELARARSPQSMNPRKVSLKSKKESGRIWSKISKKTAGRSFAYLLLRDRHTHARARAPLYNRQISCLLETWRTMSFLLFLLPSSNSSFKSLTIATSLS